MNKQNLINCLDMDLECLERAGKWASKEWFAVKERRDTLIEELCAEEHEYCCKAH